MMFMQRLRALVSELRDLVATFDASTLSADGAVASVESFGEIARLADAGRTLAARRVAATRAWRARGASSATAWLAHRAGSTLGDAAAMLQTAAALDASPVVRTAFVSGRLSADQASEVATAAAADPDAAIELLALAERESFAALRERCRDVRAAASGDEGATERIRLGRYLRHWTDRDGAVRLDARLAPDDAAPLIAAVDAGAERLRRDARRSGGAIERNEAYAADALVGMTAGRHVSTTVHVHVSRSALERGRTAPGETCRIEGVGPISVAAAQRFAANAAMRAVVGGVGDVRAVSRSTRMIPAALRTALDTRDPTCVVPGCNRRYGLEIDHVVPYARGGKTELANLARLCRWHHAQKTHHGWRLTGPPDRWTWTHPAHGARAP
jgi:hypothetical protein